MKTSNVATSKETLCVGDRVVVTGMQSEETFDNEVGEVVVFTGWIDVNVGIKFKTPREDFHDLDGMCEDKYGWWINKTTCTLTKCEKDVITSKQPITSYEFRGKYSMELLCREASRDGVAAFLVIEKGDPGQGDTASAIVRCDINYNFTAEESSSGYSRYPFSLFAIPNIIKDIKSINKQEEDRIKELKEQAFNQNKGEYKNKVIYIK